SCHRGAVSAGRSHPPPAPWAWGTTGPAASGGAQQSVAAPHPAPRVAELHPSVPPKRPAEGDQALREPQRAPRPGGRDGGQPFGEDAAAAAAIAAKPFADA